MSHIVVTGGLGFIGSYITEAYLERGNRVTVIDSGASSVRGLSFADHPSAEVVRRPVEEYLHDGGSFDGVERVIHCAARLGPAELLNHEGTLGRDLVLSTSAVIEASLVSGSKLCVFSSSEVYGRGGLLSEDDALRVPPAYNSRIEYAAAKVLTEVMTLNSRTRGLEAVVIRPFNISGARQSIHGGHVLPNFVRQALAGDPLTVFAGGDQSRSFCAPDDLARFVTDYMDAALHEQVDIVNVGNAVNETTMSRLASRVRDLAGSSSEVRTVDAQSIYGPRYFEAEATRRVPDLTRASRLGWRPTLELDDLILSAIDYGRELSQRGDRA